MLGPISASEEWSANEYVKSDWLNGVEWSLNPSPDLKAKELPPLPA